MKRVRKGLLIFLIAIVPTTVSLQSCEEVLPIIIEVIGLISQAGWLADQENMDDIPEDITPLPYDGDTDNLPARVMLEDKFPPIGDQGQYGTCVAWSVGYNLKTSLNAIEKGWNTTQLASTANQTSPRSLWQVIPSGKKGSGCNGTNFEPALDALISNGADYLSSVPYSDASLCTGTGNGNSDDRLANYRKIASETQGLTVENFKGYLSAGRPISIGARLGDRFMGWNNSNPISSDTYNNPGMQHAYHAMVLAGYDDSKNAFRVRNSWGPTWGDNGSIWVDYDFFCKSFCFAAFVAQNVNSVSVGTSPTAGDDLLAYYAEDNTYEADPNDDVEGDESHNRIFSYDVYNSGTTTIYPTQDWTVTYMFYNAKNAKEYTIIYDDYYTDDFGDNEDHLGENPNSTASLGGYWNYMTVQPWDNVFEGYQVSYEMPKITGSYYLVVMADAYDVIKEVNEDNNFYFITADNGKPLEFNNGVITNLSKSAVSIRRNAAEKRPVVPFADTDWQTTVKPGNLNAYTPSELKTMLLHEKKTGKLDAKRKAFHAENKGKSAVKRIRK